MKSTFTAKKIVTPADWRTGEPVVWADCTAEVLAMGNPGCKLVKHNGALMTAETRAALVKADRVPPRDTTPGQEYDRKRAMVYFEAMTGRPARDVHWADTPVHGEKKPRVCAVSYFDEFNKIQRWPVPHWDWNGHNQPIAECELFDDQAAARRDPIGGTAHRASHFTGAGRMKKITLTVENKLYGPAQYPAYADRGLCVYWHGRAWHVAHVASGMTVDVRAPQHSKARACELMTDLLALPLDWDRPWDELKADFSAMVGDVKGVTARYRPG